MGHNSLGFFSSIDLRYNDAAGISFSLYLHLHWKGYMSLTAPQHPALSLLNLSVCFVDEQVAIPPKQR